MRPCKTCGKNLSVEAKACPHCGWKVFLLFWLILIFLFVPVKPCIDVVYDGKTRGDKKVAVEQTESKQESKIIQECRSMCECSFKRNFKMAKSIQECADFCAYDIGPSAACGWPVHPSCCE